MHSSGGPHDEAPWSVGFCDCFSDIKTCCMACLCPCIAFGRISEIVDKGSTSCGASGAREACGDCIRHLYCEICALTQEYRELQNRGLDMSIGWHANVEKNQGLAMAPVVEKGMSK
ncbi:hypothetical protein CXB51_001521 [Gossypium anomalum]|uniref:PLAC8 family protein n=1 Tax=Gossypium anomalum TaxID=47600 RepID=A0A8J5Z5X6_9ROSI|nr:hypothetical protein CXB51_001521 [Gossypium anomalum]